MSNLTPIRVTGTLTPSGTQNVDVVGPLPLPVTIVDETDFLNPINVFSQLLVPYGAVTTILTYTVPASFSLQISQVLCWGDTCGEFLIKVNGTTKGGGRTTASYPNFAGNYISSPITAATGDIITITAEQYTLDHSSQIMKANLLGGLI